MKRAVMILTSIEIKNYKKYKEFSLSFGDGLIGVIGKNGSGKSTIFDAINFALYGDTRGEKQTIKNSNSTSKDIVQVSLEFEIDGKSYKVIRELRGKTLVAKAYLYDSEENLLSSTAKEVTAEVTKLVGMNKEAFMHTVFASQKELTSLSELKNEDRKKIIRKLLGLEKIDKIEQEIKSNITELNRDIKSFLEVVMDDKEVDSLKKQKQEQEKAMKLYHDEIKIIENEFKTTSKELENIEKSLKTLQIKKDEFFGLENELKLLDSSLQNQKTNRLQLDKKLQTLKQKQTEFSKDKSIMIEYEKLLEDIKYFQKQKELKLKKDGLQKEQVALRDSYTQSQKEIKKLQESVKNLPIMIEQNSKLTKQLEEILQSEQKLQAEEQEILQAINKAKGLIEDTNKKVQNIESIGKGSNCPTCTRPLLDEYDKVISELKNTIQKLQNDEVTKKEQELQKLQKQKDKLLKIKTNKQQELKNLDGDIRIIKEDEKRLAQKQKEFEKIKAKGLSNKKELELLKDVYYDEIKHKEALRKRDSLETKYKELLGIKKLIEQIPQLENESNRVESSIKEIEKKISQKNKEIKAHTYDEKEHQKTENLFAKTRATKESISKTMTDKKIELTKLQGKINEINSKLQTDEEQKNKLQQKRDDKNDYEKLKVLLSEFKNAINSHLAPRISSLASDMYATITKGKYQHIEVNNEFDFFIYDDGKAYPIERFSGGEVDLANLVLRIAISKTISELSGSKGVGFLAFDEVFGSQDEERRQQIMEAFHSIKEQYRQIFLISHESEIKEMFERVVEL